MRMLRAELPAELDAVILRALSRDRNRRFADLDEFARALLPFAPGVRLRDTADTTGRFRFHSGLLGTSSSDSSDTNPTLRGPQDGRASLTSQRTPSLHLGGDSVPSMQGGSASADAMLGAAHSVQGTLARPTPAGPAPVPTRPRLGWALLGLGGVAALGFGIWMMTRQPAGVATGADSKSAPVPVGISSPAPRPALLPADEPLKAAEHAEMPSTKVEPAAGADLAALEPPAGVEPPADLQKSSGEHALDAIIVPVQAKQPAVPDRGKRVRPQPPVKARSVKLIPGDRTKGLSVDEF
jgi:hypothetical protein